MASVGLGLLANVLRDQTSFSELASFGINSNFFLPNERKVFNFIQKFLLDHKAYPTAVTVTKETGEDLSGYPTEPLSYWAERVSARRSMRIAVSEAQKVLDLARDGKTVDAIHKARRLHLAIEKLNPTAEVSNLVDASVAVLKRHDELQKFGRLVFGSSFGFEYFDSISGGAQPGDSIALVGRPSTGKSFVLFKMLNASHDANFKPVLVSFEMPIIQCARRIIGIRTGMSTTQMRIGRMGYFGRSKVVEGCTLIANDIGWKIPIIQGSVKYTVEDLLIMVQELGANVLFIDGAYFMKTRSSTKSKFETVSAVAEILKTDGAIDLNIPVISTYQFNKRAGKKGGGLGDIYMSDDIAQLASIVFKLYNDEDTTEGAIQTWSPISYKIIELIKGREGERGKIRVAFDMLNTIIEQDAVLSDYRTFFQDDK